MKSQHLDRLNHLHNTRTAVTVTLRFFAAAVFSEVSAHSVILRDFELLKLTFEVSGLTPDASFQFELEACVHVTN